MVLEADRLGCLREVLVIAAALSIQDPRERPVGAAGAGRPAARPLPRPNSDFLACLNLWRYLREQQKELRLERVPPDVPQEYLNYLRVREWQDLDRQLRQVAKRARASSRARPARSPTRTPCTRRCWPACSPTSA